MESEQAAPGDEGGADDIDNKYTNGNFRYTGRYHARCPSKTFGPCVGISSRSANMT